jgi:hypothetical protein
MKDLRTFIPNGSYHLLTKSNILEIKCEEKMRLKWITMRRNTISALVRERTGDPSMTAQGYKTAKMISSTRECNWSTSLSIV